MDLFLSGLGKRQEKPSWDIFLLSYTHCKVLKPRRPAYKQLYLQGNTYTTLLTGPRVKGGMLVVSLRSGNVFAYQSVFVLCWWLDRKIGSLREELELPPP